MYSTYFILVPWCSYGQTLANETLNLKCSTDYETMKYDTISIKHNNILFKEHRLCNLGRSLLSYTRAGNKNKNKNNNNTNNNTNNGNSNKASCAHHRHQRLQYSISGHCSICFSFLFFFLHFVFKAFVMKC
ncbi:hypothetical protein GQX74_013595 [Glossina fuscipes]|nr:hypothetical protein GQX74_013595 [Glossina fuscipes]